MARASSPQYTAQSGSSPLRTASLILLSLATLLSGWLAYQSMQSGPVPGCSDGECGIVLSSKWAKVFGLPVGLFGCATYLGLIFLAARPFRPDQRTVRIAAATLLLLIPAAGLWFAGLQLFVLKAFCKWCSATHAIAIIGAICMALAWRREEVHVPATARPSSQPKKRKGPKTPTTATATAAAVPAPPFWGIATAAAALAFGGFILIQSLSPEPPKPRIVTASMSSTPSPLSAPSIPSNSTPSSATVVTQALAPAPSPTASPTPTPDPSTVDTLPDPTSARSPLSLHDGRFNLIPSDWPHYGSLEATHRIVMISDFTCIHCRQSNRVLAGVRESFGSDKLLILMLPTHHGGESLEIQQMMLTTWTLDPKAWSEVATEIYYDRLPPKAAPVRAMLESRLGAQLLADAMRAQSAWSSTLLATTKEILVANREKTKSGSIPQFIIGSEIVVGSPDDDTEFYELFEKHLGLVRERFPELSLATTDIQLGRVFAGTSRVLSIALTNTGATDLQLSRATPPPGSRVTRGLMTPIAPGQTSVVEVALAAPRVAGPFEHQLTLFSNARSNQTQIRISGLVWKPIQITPTTLDFGRLDPDNTRTQGVLRIEFEEPARVASVRSQNPGFQAAFREVAAGKTYDIDVSTTASLGFGNQQSTLLVTLAKPVPEGWPESLAVAARAVVDRAVTVVPQRFVLPSGPLTTERHLQALVRCTDGLSNFQVLSAVLEGGPESTQPQIQPTGANGIIVRFTLPSGWSLPLPPLLPRLVIQTTHPKFPVLDIPFVTQ